MILSTIVQFRGLVKFSEFIDSLYFSAYDAILKSTESIPTEINTFVGIVTMALGETC